MYWDELLPACEVLGLLINIFFKSYYAQLNTLP